MSLAKRIFYGLFVLCIVTVAFGATFLHGMADGADTCCGTGSDSSASPSAELMCLHDSPPGMAIILYGMSSVGKSETRKAMEEIIRGRPNWVSVVMDAIPQRELDSIEPLLGELSLNSIPPEVFCTIKRVKDLLLQGKYVICDAVLSGESARDAEEIRSFFCAELRNFTIVPVLLGVNIQDVVKRVQERNLRAKSPKDRRLLLEVLSHFGRVFTFNQYLSHDRHDLDSEDDEVSSILSVSPALLQRAARSPDFFGGPKQSPSICARTVWIIQSELGLSSPSKPFCVSPRLAPDVMINTERNSPTECAEKALFTALKKDVCMRSSAMRIYDRSQKGGVMCVPACDKHYHEEASIRFRRIESIRPVGSVVLNQTPGLFALYPFLSSGRLNRAIQDDPSGYYASFYATQIGLDRLALIKHSLGELLNNREAFENHTLRHGIDIIKHDRLRQFRFAHKPNLSAFGNLRADEIKLILDGTLGCSDTNRFVVVLDPTSTDRGSLQDRFKALLMQENDMFCVIFKVLDIFNYWVAMFVEKNGTSITATVIDPFDRDRFSDPGVIKLCNDMQLL